MVSVSLTVALVAVPALGPFALLLVVIASLVIGGAMLAREERAESLAVKAMWRDALSRHDLTHARLAAMLRVNVSTVDAVLSDARADRPVPHWWLLVVPAEVRADVEAGVAALVAGRAQPEESLEQSLQRVMLRARSVDTTAMATVVPNGVWRVGREAAAQLARVLGDLHAAVGKALPLAARRVQTGGHAPAKGGAR